MLFKLLPVMYEFAAFTSPRLPVPVMPLAPYQRCCIAVSLKAAVSYHSGIRLLRLSSRDRFPIQSNEETLQIVIVKGEGEMRNGRMYECPTIVMPKKCRRSSQLAPARETEHLTHSLASQQPHLFHTSFAPSTAFYSPHQISLKELECN